MTLKRESLSQLDRMKGEGKGGQRCLSAFIFLSVLEGKQARNLETEFSTWYLKLDCNNNQKKKKN